MTTRCRDPEDHNLHVHRHKHHISYFKPLETRNSAFYPQNAFMGFVWFSELTTIIYLNRINELIFVIEKFSVFFKVRTVLLK
jgi:hypothetical protein